MKKNGRMCVWQHTFSDASVRVLCCVSIVSISCEANRNDIIQAMVVGSAEYNKERGICRWDVRDQLGNDELMYRRPSTART